MTVKKALRLRILQLCKERHMTANRLCAVCGVAQSTLSNILCGRNRSTTVSTIQKLCDGLGIELSTFFDSDLFRSLEQEK